MRSFQIPILLAASDRFVLKLPARHRVCNAEWQVRGISEKLVKVVAIHISTLVMVAEYVAALDMSSCIEII